MQNLHHYMLILLFFIHCDVLLIFCGTLHLEKNVEFSHVLSYQTELFSSVSPFKKQTNVKWLFIALFLAYLFGALCCQLYLVKFISHNKKNFDLHFSQYTNYFNRKYKTLILKQFPTYIFFTVLLLSVFCSHKNEV